MCVSGSLTLKMKLGPPSLPRSSYVSSSFGLYCNAGLDILFVSILCMCCSYFSLQKSMQVSRQQGGDPTTRLNLRRAGNLSRGHRNTYKIFKWKKRADTEISLIVKLWKTVRLWVTVCLNEGCSFTAMHKAFFLEIKMEKSLFNASSYAITYLCILYVYLILDNSSSSPFTFLLPTVTQFSESCPVDWLTALA
jgi:hypothetical protein